MSTKHTPGPAPEPTPEPWRYEPETKTIRAVPSNYWLASMNSFEGAVDHEANANLIAAAPELLNALRSLKKAIQDARLLDVKKHFSLCVADAAAGTAIAKAEGRLP